MEARNDLIQISMNLQEYYMKGYRKDVEDAVRHAQCATREYIERMHPATAFGGKSLRTAQTSAGGTDNLIQKGSFKISAMRVDANIYANYFARWYNTGVYFKKLRFGPHKGEMPSSKRYRGPHEQIFVDNIASIEEYFAKQVQEFMARKMKRAHIEGGGDYE